MKSVHIASLAALAAGASLAPDAVERLLPPPQTPPGSGGRNRPTHNIYPEGSWRPGPEHLPAEGTETRQMRRARERAEAKKQK